MARSTSTNIRPVIAVLGSILAAAVLSGCDSGPDLEKMGSISGAVTFDGAPVKEGQIVFESQDASAKPNKFTMSFTQGNYTLGGLPAGAYKVAVQPPGMQATGPVDPTKSATPTAKVDDIPEKYHQTSSSGLTATVNPGNANKFDVSMTK